MVKEFEGFRADAYTCPGDKLTIGYGHVIRDGESFESPITEDEATRILFDDLHDASSCVNRNVTSVISQQQFDSLTSFVYNIGCGNFVSSTLLKLLNKNEYEDASREFGRWIYANKKRLRGLVRRREAERLLFVSKV